MKYQTFQLIVYYLYWILFVISFILSDSHFFLLAFLTLVVSGLLFLPLFYFFKYIGPYRGIRFAKVIRQATFDDINDLSEYKTDENSQAYYNPNYNVGVSRSQGTLYTEIKFVYPIDIEYTIGDEKYQCEKVICYYEDKRPRHLTTEERRNIFLKNCQPQTIAIYYDRNSPQKFSQNQSWNRWISIGVIVLIPLLFVLSVVYSNKIKDRKDTKDLWIFGVTAPIGLATVVSVLLGTLWKHDFEYVSIITPKT